MTDVRRDEAAPTAPAGASAGARGADVDAERWSRLLPPPTGPGALAILVVALVAVPGSVLVRDWRVGLATLAAQAVLLAVALRATPPVPGVGRPGLLPRVTPAALAAVSVGFSSWLLGGRDVETGLTAALRILVLVLPGLVLASRLDPFALADALAQQVRLPARPVVAVVAALGRLESLGADWHELDRARHARGLGPGRSPVARLRHVAALTFGLLVQAMRQATRMAVAMDARGFAGARRRTWAESARWLRADSALVAGALLVEVALPALLAALL